MIKQALLIIGTIFFLTGCINLPIGDGNTLKIGKDGITFTDKNNNEHTFNIDEENESFSIQGVDENGEEYNVSLDDDDGNLNFNMSGFGHDSDLVVGENLELPFDLPEDIPFADDANIYQYGNMENYLTINYLTEDSFDQIIEIYDAYFNSSSFIEETHKQEGSDDEEIVVKQFYNSTKDNMIAITVIKGSSDEMVNVSIEIEPVNE